jgi:tetratricopeptide (TPR) repeat protein
VRGRWWFLILWPFLLAGCTARVPAGAPPDASGPALVTLVPGPEDDPSASLCASVETLWARDWDRVIAALEQLQTAGRDCGPDRPTAARLYAAYYAHGLALEAEGHAREAAARYTQAQTLAPERFEATDALTRLSSSLAPGLEVCTPETIEAAVLLPYIPSSAAGYVAVDGGDLTLDGVPFLVRGVSYTPRGWADSRFWSEVDLVAARRELDLIREAGFNVLRLALPYDVLFMCPGNGAIAAPEALSRLDAIIRLAAERGFRLVLTLNDRPDLSTYPLYSSPAHTTAQTLFLAHRYRNEAAILAWELRDAGDLDYAPLEGEAAISREQVLAWLGTTAALVRSQAPRQLITAGWLRDEAATLPYVDFVGLHHRDDAIRLRERVARLRGLTAKPLVVLHVGYSTAQLSETRQADLLSDALEAMAFDGLAGWVIWAAFDVPAEAAPDGVDSHFGLWQADYTPKQALTVARILLYPGQTPEGPAGQ